MTNLVMFQSPAIFLSSDASAKTNSHDSRYCRWDQTGAIVPQNGQPTPPERVCPFLNGTPEKLSSGRTRDRPISYLNISSSLNSKKLQLVLDLLEYTEAFQCPVYKGYPKIYSPSPRNLPCYILGRGSELSP